VFLLEFEFTRDFKFEVFLLVFLLMTLGTAANNNKKLICHLSINCGYDPFQYLFPWGIEMSTK
jgi:hypothetical protein